MSDGVKAFQFASKTTKSPKVIGEFKIDGATYRVRHLKDSAVALLIHQTSSGSADKTIAGVLDFTEMALMPEDAKAFAERALSKDNPENALSMDEIVQVFQHVLTIVTSFPTGPSSDSSTSPRRTGSGSRGTTRAQAAAEAS